MFHDLNKYTNMKKSEIVGITILGNVCDCSIIEWIDSYKSSCPETYTTYEEICDILRQELLADYIIFGKPYLVKDFAQCDVAKDYDKTYMFRLLHVESNQDRPLAVFEFYDIFK